MTALFWMFIIEVLPPRWSEFFFYLLVSFPLGLGFSFWKHKKNQHKLENIDKARARRTTVSSLASIEQLCLTLLGITC